MRWRWWIVVLCSAASCGVSSHFQDRAILWREPDTAPIPLPKSNDAPSQYVGLRDAMYLPADRELGLDYLRESINVNALDEVPDSTWFEDPRRLVDAQGVPVGLKSFSWAQMERGAMGDDPDPQPPFIVTKGKGAGLNAGFQVKDRLGRKYLFKMDPLGLLGMDTSTEVVVSRLAWAAGWKVPKEVLVDFAPAEVKVAPDATLKLMPIDETVPLDEKRLGKILRALPTTREGKIRAVASRWIDGTIIGPFAYFGRRKDDANDRVRHENRRDLRAFGTFSMWVNNIDSLETNTLDSYEGKPGQGHLIHWQQDVGGSFGARAQSPVEWWMGTDIYLAPSHMLTSLLTLGVVRRPWDGDRARADRARLDAQYPEIGNFDWERFNPETWHPVLDNPAFERTTARDSYWGTKRVLAFNEEELRGAISSGWYRAEAADRLFETLWKRREKIARAYLPKVAALEYFQFDGDQLCFDDLWLAYGFGGEKVTRYVAKGDHAGAVRTDSGAHRCVALRRKNGYHVVALAVQRAGERHPGPPVRVHFVEHDGARHLVGIERD
jgi:hypothetical protein